MQLKTINKILKEKIEEWLLTINDVPLRKEVKSSLMVSGGSIANLFLKEKVNDYDVYLQDMDVLLKLAHYYCDPLDITVWDGRLGKEIHREIMQTKFNDDEAPEWYEGGDNSIIAVASRTLKKDQVKMFCHYGYKEIGYDASELDNGELPQYRPVFISPNAISLSDDIQIVCRFTGTPEEIHKNYDFIHATNYFTWNSGVVVNNEALVSLLTRQLKYQGSLYPVTSVIRVKKFTNRGFKISAGEILKILYQVSKLDLDDPDVLEEQLIGVDIAYFSTILNILRGRDTSSPMTENYLFTIIDKVFGADSE